MRFASSVFASAAALVVSSAAAAPAPISWNEALAGLVLPGSARVVEIPSGVDPETAERSLRRAGFVPAVSIPPSICVVRATAGHGALPAGFVELPSSRAPMAAGLPGAGSRDAAAAAAIPAEEPPDPFGGLADALPPVRPDPAARAPVGAPSRATFSDLPTGLFYGTRWEDLSEFMVGRIAIAILFPESDGSADPNLYDWTPALRDSVVRSAVRGFLKWTDLAAARGVPLSFALEIHPSVPTRYEPISRPVGQEDVWIEDVLRQFVGYRGDASEMGTEFANGLRGRLGTQWAGLVMAVQNDSSSVGSFPDGLIAHARLGGPWFVIPVNNLRTTSATLDFYMEHEVAHLFWALDEFPAVNAWWSCTLTTGYFERPNYNSSIPFPGYCGVNEHCLMRGNYPDDFCLPTLEQLGWVDLDRNAVLDLFETRPSMLPDSSVYRTGAGNSLLLRGKAGETAWPNRNPYRFYAGDSISVSIVDSAFYRVDAGPWMPIAALDGRYDSGEERFEFTIPPLAAGTHSIEWDALNRNGLRLLTPALTSVTVSGSAGSVDHPDAVGAAPLRLVAGPVPARGSVRFTVEGGRGGAATARVWTATGSLAREWSVPAARPAVWTWDGRLRDGSPAPNGVYFVSVESAGERVGRRVVLVR